MADKMYQTLEAMEAEILGRMSVEKRLRGIPTQERLQGIPAQERLQGLSAEEKKRLRMMLDEEKLDG